MRERLEKFALELHPDKTRLIEFGRYAASAASGEGSANRRRSTSWVSSSSAAGHGRGVPDQTQDPGGPDAGEIAEIKAELRRRMHRPSPSREVAEVRDDGLLCLSRSATNDAIVTAFRHHVIGLWRRTLRRRSQKDRFTWDRMIQIGRRTGSRNRASFIPGQPIALPSHTRGGSRMPE